MKRLLIVLLILCACEPEQRPLPFVATSPAEAEHTALTAWVIAVSTPARTVDDQPATPSPTKTPTFTPSPTASPTQTAVLSATWIASPTRGLPGGTPAPTWTAPPPDPAMLVDDHYVFARPISGAGNRVARTYPYGGTQSGRLQVHHGVDLVNPTGTPILAAADGTVIYAGDDLTSRFGSMNDYYGVLVVIQHDFLSPQGEPVFTLYGHMINVSVRAGQRVHEGEVIGIVGSTGVALGPHLHFEVRLGDPFDFDATRNPELWIRPYDGYGTLAGRVTQPDGRLAYGATVIVIGEDATRYAYAYGDDSVNGDDAFGENFTLGDLPAGYYTVMVNDGRVRYERLIYVQPNRTTWLEMPLSP